jgi:hypothetical protein
MSAGGSKRAYLVAREKSLRKEGRAMWFALLLLGGLLLWATGHMILR